MTESLCGAYFTLFVFTVIYKYCYLYVIYMFTVSIKNVQHFFHQHFFRLRNLRLMFHSVNPVAHTDSRKPRLLKIVASFGRN